MKVSLFEMSFYVFMIFNFFEMHLYMIFFKHGQLTHIKKNQVLYFKYKVKFKELM